ncbi:hypothetical protein I862_07575 [endosymbiont of Acanthamoeba sp. UWC8]|uniref:hypothetical protein n=1 Tax=endosymbiont of Acanthamoeba sp. UWC8 TaxID=86106 RepID=UPI0004D185F5|nr:hypothetical protein [endosymbiont of Acanthamoeba sp. UWC8]AIF82069.1 hypothetical protein I862_07575 [endosymbiont of Acanthamoeba sp. UWC8]
MGSVVDNIYNFIEEVSPYIIVETFINIAESNLDPDYHFAFDKYKFSFLTSISYSIEKILFMNQENYHPDTGVFNLVSTFTYYYLNIIVRFSNTETFKDIYFDSPISPLSHFVVQGASLLYLDRCLISLYSAGFKSENNAQDNAICSVTNDLIGIYSSDEQQRPCPEYDICSQSDSDNVNAIIFEIF